MKLCQCQAGRRYVITDIRLSEPLKRRLEELGIKRNAEVFVQSRKNSGTLIIKVRESRLALGHLIGEGIETAE